MEITEFDVFSGNSLEWTEQGFYDGGKDASKLDGPVQTGRSGEDGANHSGGGVRSKLGAVNQIDIRYIRVGAINCSAFGGLKCCDFGSM